MPPPLARAQAIRTGLARIDHAVVILVEPPFERGIRFTETKMRPNSVEESDVAVIPEELLAACYSDMRRIARGLMARDGMARFIQPTELANEAAIRLLRSNLAGVADQGHMLAFAARTMRQVLIGEARKSMANKRKPLTMLTLLPDSGPDKLIDLEALDRALTALAEYSAEHAKIVELRFMLGLTLAEIVTATGIPERTVTRRWQAARLWLLEHIGEADAG